MGVYWAEIGIIFNWEIFTTHPLPPIPLPSKYSMTVLKVAGKSQNYCRSAPRL